MRRAFPHRSHPLPRCNALAPFRPVALAIAPALVAALLWTAPIAAAQTTAPASSQNPSNTQPNARPAPAFHQRRKPVHPVPKAPLTPQTATPVSQLLAAPAPEQPHWPANDHPSPARIVWDSHGLRIDAANASLSDILAEVSTLTGAHVDGFASDARIYGQYGPGLARDVLSQLLDGTGYNVIMSGDLGLGAPRQIVLSARTTGGAVPAAHPAQSNDDDVDVEEPAQPQPNPQRPPFNNPAGLRQPQFPPDQQHQQGPPGQPPQQQNQQ